MVSDYKYSELLKVFTKAKGTDLEVRGENTFIEKIIHKPTGIYFYTGTNLVCIYSKTRAEYDSSPFQWLKNYLFNTEKKILDKMKGK